MIVVAFFALAASEKDLAVLATAAAIPTTAAVVTAISNLFY